MSEASPGSEPFSVLDWVGVTLVGFAVLGLFAFPLIAHTFETMYADLGGTLPLLTQFVLKPWAAPLLALLPLGLMIYGVRFSRRIKQRRAFVIAAFIVSCAVFGLCIEGLYMPLVIMGENIRAE